MTNKKLLQFSDAPKPPSAGRGRPAGVPNKVTGAFRETVNRLLDDNADNASRWLNSVAEQDPARALDLLVKLAEYAVPKLARTEVRAEIDSVGPPSLSVHFHEKRLTLEELEAEIKSRGLSPHLLRIGQG